MIKQSVGRLYALALMSATLVGCKPFVELEPAYELANQCVSVQSVGTDAFLIAEENSYTLAPVSEQAAEPFLLKPTRLGAFLLYDSAGQFLAGNRIAIRRDAEATKFAEWQIVNLAGDEPTYTMRSLEHDQRLVVGESGPILRGPTVAVSPRQAAFRLLPQPTERCQAFPEDDINAELQVTAFDTSEVTPAGPVSGFVDLHAHLAFPKALGSLAMAGTGFHPYGIEHALHDCRSVHGTGGKLDFLGSQTGGGSHETAGYPELTFWPNRESPTHIQAYHTWLRRAHLSGLRIVVTLATGNPTFCQLLGLMKPTQLEGDCSATDAIAAQSQYVYDLQDYLDAQAGGPGKGWLRVVTSPAEARAAIARDQLAVVLGTEHGTLFECRHDAARCSPEYVDEQLDKLRDLGVRSVYPLHRFDNAFGGARPAGGASGAWMHLTSKMSTSEINHLVDLINPWSLLFKPVGGYYWDIQQCPAGIEGRDSIMSMRQFVDEDMRFLRDMIASVPAVGPVVKKVFDATFFEKLGPLPEYTEFQQGVRACNVRPLQSIGHYLINGLIDRGMILEIDHMSYATLMPTLDILEARQYSGVVSSHGWLENSAAIRDRVFRLGGIIGPMNSKPSNIAATFAAYSQEMASHPYLIGLGIGTDIQGVTSQTDGDAHIEIQYPFTSRDGRVTFYPPSTGNRQFDYHKEGIAHYGLLPEWVENMRQIDEQVEVPVMDLLFNSAEAYLQMWERAESARIR